MPYMQALAHKIWAKTIFKVLLLYLYVKSEKHSQFPHHGCDLGILVKGQ